jgi:uncharacterized protein (DUF433 family)
MMTDKLVIESHIEIREDQARFKNRNLKVEPVARMHVNGGASIEEVMEHYGLTRSEVYAALTYFYDNQKALDARYEDALEIGRKAGARDFADLRAEIEARRRDQQD